MRFDMENEANRDVENLTIIPMMKIMTKLDA